MAFGSPFINSFDSFMFSFVPIFISIVFIIVLVGFVMAIFKGIGQWKYNNAQPVLTVQAKLVSKRTNVSQSSSGNIHDSTHHHHTYTNYYITFQVESGDRIEFEVKGNEYGLLVEGDSGNLTFQGTRYLGFKRGVAAF